LFVQQIMLPIIRKGHWTLYVVNIRKKCIEILDSNPYGEAMGGTTWKMYHNAQIELPKAKKLPWSRLLVHRLSAALQQARSISGLPKFSNWTVDLLANCPTMKAASNDCGFFVMKFMQLYEWRLGRLTATVDAVSMHFLLSVSVFHIILC